MSLVPDIEALNGRLLFAIPKKGGTLSLMVTQRRLIAAYRKTARAVLAAPCWCVCRADGWPGC